MCCARVRRVRGVVDGGVCAGDGGVGRWCGSSHTPRTSTTSHECIRGSFHMTILSLMKSQEKKKKKRLENRN